jgi:hypothetical protein
VHEGFRSWVALPSAFVNLRQIPATKLPRSRAGCRDERSGRIESGRPPVVLEQDERSHMSLLWIILIVVLVLVLLGFVGRGRY